MDTEKGPLTSNPPESLVRRLFAGDDPRAILARISEGDPLRLEPFCVARAREKSVLIDPETLFVRTMAQVAIAAPRRDENSPLDRWLRDRVDDAIRDTLRRDREALDAGFVPEEPLAPRFAYFMEALGIEPESTLSAIVAFNELPRYTRESFFALILEARPLQEVLAEGFGPPDDLRLRVRTALCALTYITPDRIRLSKKVR